MQIREVRRVGYNIDQLLKLANAKGLLDVPQLRKALADNCVAEKMIVDFDSVRSRYILEL